MVRLTDLHEVEAAHMRQRTSHISTNFDRSAYQQDPNIWFPLDRLGEMAAGGEIAGLSN